MKRLLSIASLMIPAYLLAQGFGVFSRDQPFLAGEVAAGGVPIAMPTTNLLMWFKADSGIYSNRSMTVPAYNGSVALGWTNSITNSFNALSFSEVATSPRFYTNIVNGLPAILFDGGGGAQEMVPTASLVIAQPFQVFCVFNPTNAGASGALWSDRNLSLWGQTIGSPDSYWWHGGGNFFYYAADPRNTWRITCAQANGASSLVRTNGVLANSGNMSADTLVGITIGDIDPFGSDAYKGWIAEFILFVPSLSSNDTFTVERYLSQKYQITNSVLTGF